jgi:hypothetical protein
VTKSPPQDIGASVRARLLRDAVVDPLHLHYAPDVGRAVARVAGGTVVRGCHASSRRVRFVSPEPRERRQAAATGLKVPVYAYCGGQTLHPSRNWGEIEGESPSGYPVVDGMRPDFAPWRGQFWGRDSFRQTYWGNAAQVRPGAALAAARHARSLARVAVCAAALAYVSACANRLPHVELETQQGEVFDDAAGAPDTLDTAEASAPSCKPRWTSDASIPEPCNGRDDDCDGLTDEDDQACHCGGIACSMRGGLRLRRRTMSRRRRTYNLRAAGYVLDWLQRDARSAVRWQCAVSRTCRCTAGFTAGR